MAHIALIAMPSHTWRVLLVRHPNWVHKVGEANKFLACQMYRGNLNELPLTANIREDPGFTFNVYRQHGLIPCLGKTGHYLCPGFGISTLTR